MSRCLKGRLWLVMICVIACLLTLCTAGLAEMAQPYELSLNALTVFEGVEVLGDNSGVPGSCDFMDVLLHEVEHVTLPSTLKTIKSDALYSLGAQTLILPEGLKTIEPYAFEYAKLRSLSLPSTLREVGGSSFLRCDHLAEITLAESNPYFQLIDGVLFTKDLKTLVYYPAGREDGYYAVPAGTETVGDRAFYGNDFLTAVSLPMSVTAIESGAFISCGSLRSVALPLTLRQIGDYGFFECVNLEQISLPASLSLGKEAFGGCLKLTGETVPPLSYDDATPQTEGIVNLDNAEDTLNAYERPDASSPVITRLGCGSSVTICGQQNGFYCVHTYFGREDTPDLYVAADQVVLSAPTQSLYTLSGLSPKSARSRYYYNFYALPFSDVGNAFVKGDVYSNAKQSGLWIQFSTLHDQPDQYGYVGTSFYCYALPADVTLARKPTHDGKTYGMVISPKPQNRLNLREAPKDGAKVLARYFSGAQVEILDETGKWYHVRVAAYDLSGYIEGYAVKDFIAIVEPQEEE